MKQRIFSGIQPSGNLHIGNYLGAIKNWVKLQNEYDSIFCVVDMHAITVPQDPEQLRKKTIEVAKIYLASGIDPEKCSIFIQSHISEHAELAWILNTITKISELERMTQFKDKSGIIDIKKIDKEIFSLLDKIEGEISKTNTVNSTVYKSTILNILDLAKKLAETRQEYEKQSKISVGLFDYPVLMAADILLYDTSLVPVGKDQLQHIELARTLAERFNKKFGNTFAIPKPYASEEGQNIMGLDDPSKKMSKSASSEYNYISLTDDEKTVRRKIKKAVTDSGSEIVYTDDKPALKNLINIYSLLSDIPAKEIEKKYQGKGPASTRGDGSSTRGGYADFKTDLAETIISFLRPLQDKINNLPDEKVLEILHAGAEKVRPLAKNKLKEVKRKIGFIE
jgi:tryptophanyl-tRNA synthetase